jgi:hypothetical protein
MIMKKSFTNLMSRIYRKVEEHKMEKNLLENRNLIFPNQCQRYKKINFNKKSKIKII